MSEDKVVDRQGVTSIWFARDMQRLRHRVEALAEYGISFNSIVMACLEACIDTLEKECPTKRRIVINGKVVIL